MVMTVGKPKTLEEVKQALRGRLQHRRSPFVLTDPQEAERSIDRLTGVDGEQWGTVWGEVGARYETAGQAVETRGDARAAHAAYVQAYAFFAVGRYPCPNHPQKQACAARGRENYVRAGRGFEPPVVRVTIPFTGRSGEGREVVVMTRMPPTAAGTRPPVAFLWGGTDGYKEERHAFTDVLLQQGFATVAMDSPGTGEAPLLASEDAERLWTPVLTWLQERADVDGRRIVGVGSSFGGYWATKVAHTHHTAFRGVVNWGGGVHMNFQPAWTERSRYAPSYVMDLAASRSLMLGLDSYAEYIKKVQAFSLLEQGWLDGPSAPLLLVNGKDDTQVPIDDVYLLLEHGRPKTARIFPGGHMGHTPDTEPTIVAWLKQQVDLAS